MATLRRHRRRREPRPYPRSALSLLYARALGCSLTDRWIRTASATRAEINDPHMSKWGLRKRRASGGAPSGSGAGISISLTKQSSGSCETYVSTSARFSTVGRPLFHTPALVRTRSTNPSLSARVHNILEKGYRPTFLSILCIHVNPNTLPLKQSNGAPSSALRRTQSAILPIHCSNGACAQLNNRRPGTFDRPWIVFPFSN